MSAPKHTPGPWHATGTGIVKDEQGRSLAIIQAPRGEIPLAEAVANGELMASAPELASRIANLESLLAEKQRQCDQLTEACRAISESVPCQSDHCRHYVLAHGKPCDVEAIRLVRAALGERRTA